MICLASAVDGLPFFRVARNRLRFSLLLWDRRTGVERKALEGKTVNRIQKLCILICVFAPFAIYGAYTRGADFQNVILL